MWDFLKAIFCADLPNQIVLLEADIKDLNKVMELRDDTITELELTITEKRAEISTLYGTVDALTIDLEDMQDDLENKLNRIVSIEAALAKAIVPPDVSAFIEPRVIVEPFLHPEIGRVDPETHRMIYDIVVSDLEYYGFTKENWLQLLGLVKTEVRRILGGPSIPMTDCDNFAELTSAICHAAFIQAGLDKHGAIFIASMSGVHTYNGFIDNEGEAWIYDAMKSQNPLIGILGDTPDILYRTTDIIFIG